MKRLISIILVILGISDAMWGDDTRFVVQFGSADISWNPQHAYTTTEAQVFTALYEGLTIFHPASLDPLPGAAEGWELSDDGLSITFTLRDGLRWSHGEAITSTDFKESWIHLLSPDTGTEYASLIDDIVGAHEYRMGEGNRDEIGIETPNKRTLIVHLKQPSPQFLAILCHYSFVPVHRNYRGITDWSDITSVPVNGPYIIKHRNREETLLEKNSYYWDADNIAVNELLLLFSDEVDENMARFNRLEIDWVVSGIRISELGNPEALITSPLFSTTYFYFSNVQDVWADDRVRRALTLLLPWDEIRKNQLIPATSLVPPIPDYPLADASFPPAEECRDEAMRLLTDVGYPEGRGLPTLRFKIPIKDDVVDIMAKTWFEELGLQVNIEIVPFPHYYSSVKQGGYDIATLTWTGDYADPHTFLGMWTSSSSFNEAGYSNADFDLLLHEAAQLPRLERLKKMSQAETILLQSGEVLPIEHFPAVNIIDRRFIDGWFTNVLDIHPFKNLSPVRGFHIPGVVWQPSVLEDVFRQGGPPAPNLWGTM